MQLQKQKEEQKEHCICKYKMNRKKYAIRNKK
jgi:hypothetical protein